MRPTQPRVMLLSRKRIPLKGRMFPKRKPKKVMILLLKTMSPKKRVAMGRDPKTVNWTRWWTAKVSALPQGIGGMGPAMKSSIVQNSLLMQVTAVLKGLNTSPRPRTVSMWLSRRIAGMETAMIPRTRTPARLIVAALREVCSTRRAEFASLQNRRVVRKGWMWVVRGTWTAKPLCAPPIPFVVRPNGTPCVRVRRKNSARAGLRLPIVGMKFAMIPKTAKRVPLIADVPRELCSMRKRGHVIPGKKRVVPRWKARDVLMNQPVKPLCARTTPFVAIINGTSFVRLPL